MSTTSDVNDQQICRSKMSYVSHWQTILSAAGRSAGPFPLVTTRDFRWKDRRSLAPAAVSSVVASLLGTDGQCRHRPMLRRLERFCAIWLIAQILVPFTAPFPICDLSDVLGSAHHHGAPLVPANSRAIGDYSVAPPLATTAGRLRLVVVSSLDVSSVVGVPPAVALRRPFAAALDWRQLPQIQPTVLRL
jgi:hypothetical protein